MTEHRILTVRQPWAKAIIDGHKPIENRSKGFSKKYLGPVWIHAASTWSDRGLSDDRILEAYGNELEHGFRVAGFALGCIIGRVEISGAHLSERGCCASPWAEDHYLDAKGALVSEVTHLELAHPESVYGPICRGALGLWRPDPDLALELDLLEAELRGELEEHR